MDEQPSGSSGEPCLRCGAAMDWRDATWQCPRCRSNVSCCEGETGDCRFDAASPKRAAAAA